MRENESLFALLEELVLKADATLPDTSNTPHFIRREWQYLLNLLDRLEIAVEQLLHNYSEDVARQVAVKGEKGLTHLTVMEQAYAYKEKRLETKDLGHPVAALLGLLFAGVDQHINDLLCLGSQDALLTSEVSFRFNQSFYSCFSCSLCSNLQLFVGF